MNRLQYHLLGVVSAALTIFLFLPGLPATAGAEEGAKQLTLEEAYRMALRSNEQIAIARQQLNQAEASVKVARSPLLPQINLEAKTTQQKQTAFINIERYSEIGVSASQSLYQGGKLWSNYDASKYAAASQANRFYRTRQQILYSVAQSFYNVLFARRSIEIAENQLRRSKRQLQLAQQRQEVGLVDMTAVLRAQVQVAAAREALERARNQYTVAMERLTLEMGVSQPPASLAEPESMEFDLAPMSRYLDTAFENRRDLESARKSLLAAKEQLDSEQADFIPDFSLQGSYSKADDDEIFYGSTYFWQVSLVGSYPLFTGFRNSAEVTRAKAAEAEAKAQVNRLEQEIRLDVRSAYADIQTRKKVITSLQDQVESARANYRQITAQFEEGLVSAVDVVDAETALNEAERRLAITYYQYQLNQLNLKLATGTYVGALLQPSE